MRKPHLIGQSVFHLVLSVVFLSFLVMANATPTTTVQSTTDWAKLPTAAQAFISASLSQDNPTYHFQATPDGWQVRHPGQGMESEFTAKGSKIRAGEANLTLRLIAFGSNNTQQAVHQAIPQAKANRLEYARGMLTEWYMNGPLGLEQGFTVHAPPDMSLGSSGIARKGITLIVAMESNLGIRLDQGAKGITLSRGPGQALLHYGGLFAFDADGRELNSWMELGDQTGTTLRVHLDDSGARYPVTIDPWIQAAKLTANDGATEDQFGLSVAISGDTIVVGAPDSDSGGKTYVFIKPTNGWSNMFQSAKLVSTVSSAGDKFGESVAISGDTVIVGARGLNTYRGKAFVYVKPTNGWSGTLTESCQLTASNGANYDNFGNSVAISGDIAVVGARYGGTPDTGIVYVFLKGSNWFTNRVEIARLKANDAEDGADFGYSVAISGNTIVVGSPWARVSAGTVYPGAAYVFADLQWLGDLTDAAKLKAYDGVHQDQFGLSVAIEGDTVAVGTKYGHSNYVFIRPLPNWIGGLTVTENARLVKADGTAFAWAAVAISGDTIVVGSFHQGVYVYTKPSSWSGTRSESAKLMIPMGSDPDVFVGDGVAVSGNTLVAGAPSDSAISYAQGSAFVFKWFAALYNQSLPLLIK